MAGRIASFENAPEEAVVASPRCSRRVIVPLRFPRNPEMLHRLAPSARGWLDREGVVAVADGGNSATTLAALSVLKDHDRVFATRLFHHIRDGTPLGRASAEGPVRGIGSWRRRLVPEWNRDGRSRRTRPTSCPLSAFG